MTRFHKRIFPLMWFGVLGFFVIVALVAMSANSTSMPAIDAVFFLAIPVAMAAFGFFLMKMLVWDLVDEVYDAGDYLLVRNGDVEERIPLANIMNVSATMFMNPPRITLRLVSAGKLGHEIAFSPVKQFSLNPFAKSRIAEGLIERVYRARLASR